MPVLPHHSQLGRGGLATSLAALDRLRTVPPGAAQPWRGALSEHGTAGGQPTAGADRTVLSLPPNQQFLQLTRGRGRLQVTARAAGRHWLAITWLSALRGTVYQFQQWLKGWTEPRTIPVVGAPRWGQRDEHVDPCFKVAGPIVVVALKAREPARRS